MVVCLPVWTTSFDNCACFDKYGNGKKWNDMEDGTYLKKLPLNREFSRYNLCISYKANGE